MAATATKTIAYGSDITLSATAAVRTGEEYDSNTVSQKISFNLASYSELKNAKISSIKVSYTAGKITGSNKWFNQGYCYLNKIDDFKPATSTKQEIQRHNQEAQNGSYNIGTSTFYVGLYVIVKGDKSQYCSTTGTITISNISLEVKYEPSESAWSINKTTVTAGVSNDLKVTITPASSAYRHRVIGKIGSTNIFDRSIAKTDQTTITENITLSESVRQYFPNASSAAAVITVQTIDDSTNTVVGSSSKNITINKGDYTITASGSSLSFGNTFNNICLQNRTTATEEITVKSTGYSPITVTWKAGSQTHTQTVSASDAAQSSGKEISHTFTLTGTGTYSFSVTLKDARGITTSYNYNQNKDVKKYTVPKITKLTCERCDNDQYGTSNPEGEYAKICRTATFDRSIDGNGITYKYFANGDEFSTSALTGDYVLSARTFNKGQSFTIKIEATDNVGTTVSMQVTLSQASVYMYWKEDSICFFAMPSSNASPTNKEVKIGEDATLIAEKSNIKGIASANYIEVTPTETTGISSSEQTMTYRIVYGIYPPSDSNPWFDSNNISTTGKIKITEKSLVEIGGALIVVPTAAGAMITVKYQFGNASSTTRTWCRYFTVTSSREETIVLPRKIFEAQAGDTFNVTIACDSGTITLKSYEMGSINLRVLGRT